MNSPYVNLINSIYSSRRGRSCVIPPLNSHSSVAIRNIREQSFHVHGCKLFNIMPINLRNISNCSTDVFKSHLDKFLASIPDYPNLTSLNKYCPSNTNSLLDIISYYHIIT